MNKHKAANIAQVVLEVPAASNLSFYTIGAVCILRPAYNPQQASAGIY
jgi:hypothetical protein